MRRGKTSRRETASAGLEPYPDYKPSGVEWLGDVPAHWRMRRLKMAAENVVRQTRGRGREEIYIALEHVESWTGKIRKADPDAGFDSQVKQFRAGDVLFGKLRPYLAKVARPAESGACVGEFLVLRPRADNLLPGYLEQLLRSKPIIDAVDASTFGAKMPRADWRFIGNLVLPLPPPAEQAAIARYLDRVNERIHRCIDAGERLIGLLEEKRRAVIHRAVTRGLDPDVRLKSSGVEWLGDAPAHWEVRRLKNICRFAYGDSLPSETRSGESVSVYGSNGRVGFSFLANTESPCIIIGRKGSFGKVQYSSEPVFAIDTTFFVDSRHTNASIRWLYYLLKWLQLDAVSKDSAVPGLNREDVYQQMAVFPPLAEQAAIAAHLDKAVTAIDDAIACACCWIELLREYRVCLAANVVTGKLDVREAAANSPASR